MREIKRFSIFKSSKMLAILGFVISAIYALPLGLFMLFQGKQMDLALVLLLQPIIHLILGFISGAVFFFLYNVIAKAFGGIEVEVAGGIEGARERDIVE